MENKKNNFKDYAISIVAAIIIAITFRTYVFARADVDGNSMLSTLHHKDVLFVEKISLITDNFKRGQIVIFDSGNNNEDIYVKRIIAVEGDEIEIRNNKVYLNGNELQEDYLDKDTKTAPGAFMSQKLVYKVEKDHVFVLGDNRENSVDSRTLGPISTKALKGHVVVRVYPFKNFKFF